MSLHTHVLRTTTREMPDLLNEWATRETRPGEPADEIFPTYCGGRDWVVVLRHRDHGESVSPADHDHGSGDLREDPRYLDSIGCEDRPIPVTLSGYEPGTAPVVDGVRHAPQWSGYVEDDARTWILYLDMQHRPAALWLQRDETGGVIGESIDLQQVPHDVAADLADRTEQITYEWARNARSGDYADLTLSRKVDLGEVGYMEPVWSVPIYRHDYSPDDVMRLLRDLAGALTAPRTESALKP